MRQQVSDKSPLAAVRERLSTFDSSDLAAAAGALQLVPENADRLIRLEALAHLAASLHFEKGKPLISRRRLEEVCNTSTLGQGMIAAAEDPCDDALTEAFVFFGGSHILFPGISEGVTYILRHLCRALFLSREGFPHPGYLTSARRLLSACLGLSTEIAKRASLPRYVLPALGSGRGVTVPASGRLDELKRAVRFEAEELNALLRSRGASLDDLSALAVQSGGLSVDSYSMEEPPLAITPLVTFGPEIILPSPGTLAAAARHHLVCLALEHGIVGQLLERYIRSIWDSTTRLLKLTGHPPVGPCPDVIEIPFLRQGFFFLDTDKLIFVLLVGDDLEGYEEKKPYGEWQSEPLNTKIAEQFKRAEAFAFSHLTGTNELLCLLLMGGIGRAFFVAFSGGPDASQVLMMPSYDLETILLLEGANPLALWKFARARDRIRRKASVITDSSLNEYFYFRKRKYSYYMADDFRPTNLLLSPGGAGDLRREVLAERDWHAAPSFTPGATIEVMTLHDTAAIPLYAPIESIGNQVTLLVEGLPLPVWIAGPDYARDGSDERAFHSEYAEFADTIAYWLWQMTPSISEAIESLLGTLSTILIELRIDQKEQWKLALTGAQVNGSPLETSPDAGCGRLLVALHPSILRRCTGPDNEGEREIMTAVLRGIRGLLANENRSSLSDDAISEILEKHAPLGIKKKIVFVGPRSAPELDDSGLASFRAIQESDISELLDELGDHLAKTLGVTAGPVANDQRVDLLQRVVEFFCKELQALVSCHSSESLLPWLIAYNEAVIHESAERNLTIPTSMACFSSQKEMLRQLEEELPKISSASLAGRFLVEFAAAKPPTGLRPISWEAFRYGRSIDPVVCSVQCEQLLDHLVTALSWPPEKVLSALRLLTLEKRSDFLNPGAPLNKSNVYAWRFNRPLSYLRRPFVGCVKEGSHTVMWGPRHVHAATGYLATLCTSGRLRAQSPEMLELMGKFNHYDGEAFNNKVADLFVKRFNPYVRRRVTKIKTDSGNAIPPGDIDVLAADKKRKVLYVVECKDLALARTPADLSNELLNLFVGQGGRKSTMAKYEARVEWVMRNKGQVTKWLGCERNMNWQIVPWIVVSDDLFTPYLRKSKMSVLSFRQLKGIFEEARV